MNDLIDRQAAIEAVLTELTKRERKNLLHTWSTVEVKYFTTKMLEDMPSVQQWIPCSERLPKGEKQHYWVCTDTGYQCQCRWTNDVYDFGASDRWEWKIFDIPQYQKVVAWMPLPEPYKGGQE